MQVVQMVRAQGLSIGQIRRYMDLVESAVKRWVEHNSYSDRTPFRSGTALYVKAVLPPWTGPQAPPEVAASHLAELIKKVASVEAPVHVAEVTRRIMEVFRVSRAGTRITLAISRAIEQGVRAGLFECTGEFLYTGPRDDVRVRSRSAFGAAERKIEWVAPEELDAALMQAIRAGFSMDHGAAISSALDALGFGRASANIAGKMDERLGVLVARGQIRLAEDRYAPA